MGHLDRVRSKPKAARTQQAFFTAAAITALIAAGWAFTLPAQFAELDAKKTEPEPQTGFPFSEMLAGVSGSITDLRERFVDQDEFSAASSSEASVELDIESLINQPVVIPNPTPPPQAVRIATTSARNAASEGE